MNIEDIPQDIKDAIIAQAVDVPWVAMAIAVFFGAFIASGFALLFKRKLSVELSIALGALIAGGLMTGFSSVLHAHWYYLGVCGLVGGFASVRLIPWLERKLGIEQDMESA